jgi:ribose-phosphate pyrophosphokinase
MILCFDDEVDFARALGLDSGLPVQRIARHRFPDGELKLTLPPKLGAEVRILRSLHRPNEKLLELVLAARAARELGAREVTLIAPYLAYMRQDLAFAPGEVVSQKVIGRLLAELFDAVVTVDPHLHRIATLADAVPLARAVSLSAAPLIGHFVAMRGRGRSPMLVGPDSESAQWVHVAATYNGLPWTVCRKTRLGDTDVKVELPAEEIGGREVVLVDDVASSGHTLAAAARALLAAGAARVDAVVTHAVLAPGAGATLKAAGISEFWSTDTVPHESNALSVVPLIADALRPA